MTENEAQKWLERFEWDDSEETSEALATICEALQEYPKFKAIGTIDEFKALKDCGTHDCIIKHLTNECSYKETGCSDCKSIEMIRTAVERMKPKKILHNGANWYRCPNGCEIHKKQFEKDWYCPKCGQKLDWSE